MSSDVVSTSRKAHIINEDPKIFGTFAEIGAGQEVARHFFQAGHASSTIAKTMSAYDMKISDEIYGKSNRYVSQERLNRMLDHEYDMLIERLKGQDKCLFTFSNTAATSSHQDYSSSHAWMGIRFQMRPGGPSNEIVLHVQCLDRLRLQQQEALGVLGVNLIYGAWFLSDDERMFVASLLDNLTHDRVQIDYIHCSGPDLEKLNLQLMGLELIVQKMSASLIFSPKGEIIQATDCLYGKSVVVLRGTFKPITKINIEILEKSLADAKQYLHDSQKGAMPLLEFTIKTGDQVAEADYNDYLYRINLINACGQAVLVSNFPLFYQLKTYLRRCTKGQIFIVIGSTMLEKIFDVNFYKNLSGGVLKAVGKLFDDDTKILVYPFKSATHCTSSTTFNPDKSISHLYKHLLANKLVVDIANCEEINTTIHSEDVRALIDKNDSTWKNFVPEPVVKILEKEAPPNSRRRNP